MFLQRWQRKKQRWFQGEGLETTFWFAALEAAIR
jgi:hypothetical protein